MPALAITNFNIVLSVLGGWISLFGLVSYLCKESYYMSEAFISLLVGVAFSPRAANFIRPLAYADYDPIALQEITLAFSRLVLGVQLVLAGVQLPSRYLHQQWRPLSMLLGPIMFMMWIATSLLVWALIPSFGPNGMGFLKALVIGSCVTPTDPVLSNVIVKGRFADHNVPKELQRIIVAESGANDGLGYPFLFFALYLIKYMGHDYPGDGAGAGRAMALWFCETWVYTIILSIVYGAAVGWIAKELLHWAEERKFVDRESFLVFAISLALFITGTCGMIGSDDVLACFIAGNVFTWDDWFRLETLDDSLQPTIDMLLNVTIFMWYGAVCPWEMFLRNGVGVQIYRLIVLGILVLLLRRLPWVFIAHKIPWGRKVIPQIEGAKQAIFVGFFGPVGVSAIFYLYITLEFLRGMDGPDGKPREDVKDLAETVTVVVWFMAICSVVVHGLSIPVGKLGVHLPRTLSKGLKSGAASPSRSVILPDSRRSSGGPLPSFNIGDRVNSFITGMRPGWVRPAERRTHDEHGHDAERHGEAAEDSQQGIPLTRPFYRTGGTIIRNPPASGTGAVESEAQGVAAVGDVEGPSQSQSRPDTTSANSSNTTLDDGRRGRGVSATPAAREAAASKSHSRAPGRSIRFPDDNSQGVGSAPTLVGENTASIKH
ncbi:Sodium/hydrogen exchanger family-domain-containing protein [Neurospora tetraspora]|uniref:Sodium/hydrogen exchanger family-domain-containing protein n=1 Tax=Neurospora tetraspora TaxID=94610 RepID=A0AAE0JF80_9PEZI|nr:Sodium/hydrogen exchanger family-domain-containing protein [Neurospora tetraspora]